MNECIFYGTVFNPPTARMDTVIAGRYFVKFVLCLRSYAHGKWHFDYIDLFAFMWRADLVLQRLKKGSKVCCVCYCRTKLKKLDDGTFRKQVFFVISRIYFIRDTYKKRDEYFDEAEENVFVGELGKIFIDCSDENDATASEEDRKELISAEASMFMVKNGLLPEAEESNSTEFDEISNMIDTLEKEAGGSIV